MISYCVVAYRPRYAQMLIADLIRKTTVPYEILVWLNTPDPGLRAFLAQKKAESAPLHVIGDTPHNIGMVAFKELFARSTHPFVVQMDDDVLCVSRRIAETAEQMFNRDPSIRQIVADVVQDAWTTGARPDMGAYREHSEGLYHGPIDGWFSIYHRSVLPLLLSAPYARYVYLGGWMCQTLAGRGMKGLLCTKMKVFHAIGPVYASFFGQFGFEVEKYRQVGARGIVDWYTAPGAASYNPEEIARRWEEIQKELDRFGEGGDAR